MRNQVLGIILSIIFVTGTFTAMQPLPTAEAHSSGWHDYCFDQTLNGFLNVVQILIDIVSSLGFFLAWLKPFIILLAILAALGGYFLSWSCVPALNPPKKMITDTFQGFECNDVESISITKTSNDNLSGGFVSGSLFINRATPTVSSTDADGNTETTEFPTIQNVFLLWPLVFFWLPTLIDLFLDNIKIAKGFKFLAKFLNFFLGLLFGLFDYNKQAEDSTPVGTDGDAYALHPAVGLSKAGIRNPGTSFALGKNTITYFATSATAGQTDEAPFRFNVFDNLPPEITLVKNITLEANAPFGYKVDTRTEIARIQLGNVNATDNCASPENTKLEYKGKDYYLLTKLAGTQSAEWVAQDKGYEIWEISEQDKSAAFESIQRKIDNGQITVGDAAISEGGLNKEEKSALVTVPVLRGVTKLEQFLFNDLVSKDELSKQRVDLANQRVDLESRVTRTQADALSASETRRVAFRDADPSFSASRITTFDRAQAFVTPRSLQGDELRLVQLDMDVDQKFKKFKRAQIGLERFDADLRFKLQSQKAFDEGFFGKKIKGINNFFDTKLSKLSKATGFKKLSKNVDDFIGDPGNFKSLKKFSSKLSECCKKAGKVIGTTLGAAIGPGIGAAMTAIGENTPAVPGTINVNPFVITSFQEIVVVDTTPPDILVTENIAEEVLFIVGVNNTEDISKTIDVTVPLIFDIADPFPIIEFNVTKPNGVPDPALQNQIVDDDSVEIEFDLGVSKISWQATDFSENPSKVVEQIVNVKKNNTNIVSVAFNQTTPAIFSGDPTEISVVASNEDEDPLDFFIVTIPSSGVILSAFDAIFQNVFQINGTVSRLNGISVASGNNTYLVDSSNSRVMLLTNDGDLNIAFDTSNATLDPEAIAFNGSNTFLISEWPKKILEVEDVGEDVNVLREFNVNGLFADPKNMAVHGSTIFVTDKTNGTVTKLMDRDAFGLAKGIVVDNNDNVLIVDNQNNTVANFTTSGIFSSKFGSPGNGNGEFNAPKGITVNATHIFVADSANNRIQIFNSSGTFETEISGALNTPSDVTINSTRIFVSDTGNDKIQIFNSSGTFETEIGTSGNGDGELDSPQGIVVLNNEIYVADKNNHRIQKINLANPLFSDDYSDDAPWNPPFGSGVFVNTTAGHVNFTDVTTGTLSGLNGVSRDGLEILPNDGWIADFELSTGIIRTNSTGFIWLLTNETSHPSNDDTIDALGVYLNSNQLNIYQEHGGVNNTFTGIDISNNTQYYVTFERQSKEQAKLSVFTNPERTVHVTDPPIIDVNINDNISQLQVLQHTNDNTAGEDLLNLFIDNSEIKPIKFSYLGQCDSGTNCNDDIGFEQSIGFMCTEATCSVPSSDSGNGHFNSPTDLTFNGTHFFVADTGNDRIQIFNSTGFFEQKIGTTGTEDGNFISPMGIGFDSTGNFYVSDSSSRVQKFDSSGNFVESWENSINTRFDGFMETFKLSLSKLQIDSITYNNSTNTFFVGDWTPDNEQIIKLQQGGSKIISYDVSENVSSPRNLAVNGTNVIHITDSDPTDPGLVLFDGTTGAFIEKLSLEDILFIPNMTQVDNKITIIPTGIEITKEISGPGEHLLVFDNSTEKILEISDNPLPTGLTADTVFNATSMFSNLQDIAVNATHVFGMDKTSGIKTIVTANWDKGISNTFTLPGNSSFVKGIAYGKKPIDDNQVFFVNSSNKVIYSLNLTSNKPTIALNLTDTEITNPVSLAMNHLSEGLLERFLNGTDGLSAPRDLLFDDDKLFVSNELTNSIKIYNATTGESLGEITDEALDFPKDIAIDVNGTLYVSSFSKDLVLKLNQTGELIDFVATSRSTLTNPTGLTFGPKGGLFVSNSGLDNVLRFNLTNGRSEFFVPSTTMPPLSFPQSLAFGPIDNNLYVSSYGTDEVLHYHGITGDPLGVFGDASSKNSDLDGPVDLLFSPDGKFLFVSSSKNDSVLQYNGTTGEFIGRYTDDSPTTPQGLAFGPDDNLYVANRLLSEVLVYGNVTTKFYVSDWNPANHRIFGLNEIGNVTKTFSNLDLIDPKNIATDSIGDIWIANAGNKTLVNIDRLNGEVVSIIDTSAITDSSNLPMEVTLANGTSVFVDEEGNVVEDIDLPTFSFIPNGITIDTFDTIHATNWDKNHVVLLTIDGEPEGAVILNSTVTSPGDITIQVNDDDSYDLFVYDEDLLETGKGGIIQVPIIDTPSISFLAGQSGAQMKGLEWIANRADFVKEFDGFNDPTGIENTVSSIYISDGGDNKIKVFDNAGNFRFEFGSAGGGEGQFNNPHGIAIDGINTYIVDTTNNRIQVVAPTGVFLEMIGYGVDTGANEFENCAFNTTPCQAGIAGSADGQFNGPLDIAVNSTGFIHVVDTNNDRIQIFDSDLNFVSKFGSTGAGNGKFNFPRAISIDNDDRVYVVDRDNHRVQVFDSDGEFLFKFGSQGTANGEFENPVGIDITSDKIYITDRDNERVQIFSLNGNFIFSWGTPGTNQGEYDNPNSISIDEITNKVYVVDRDNDRVQVFEPVFASLLFGHSTNGAIISSDLQTSIDVQTDVEVIPDGISVPDSNTIYVTDWRQKRIVQLDDQGDNQAEFDFSFINFADSDKLRDIDYNIDKDFFYVADARKATIPKILPNSVIIDEEQIADKFIIMSGIAVGSDDNFYVASTEEEVLNKYTERGSLLERTNISVGDGSMIDVDVRFNVTDDDDYVYVLIDETNDVRIERYNSELEDKFTVDLERTPTGIAVDSNGNMYVSGSGEAKEFIYKFSSEGVNSTSPIEITEPVGRINDIVIDSNDSLFAVDKNKNRIYRYNLTSDQYVGWMGKCDTGDRNICNVNDQIGIGFRCTTPECTNSLTGTSSGNKFGQFFNPTLITVDDFGNIYVADEEFMLPSATQEATATPAEIEASAVLSPRIQKFANNGLFIEKTVSDLSETSFAGNFKSPRGLAIGSNHFYVVDTDKLNVFDVNPFSLVEFNETTKESTSKLTYESLLDFVGVDRFEWGVDDGFNKSKIAHVNVTVNDPDPDNDGIFSSFDFSKAGNDKSMKFSNRFSEDATNTTGIIVERNAQDLLIRNDRDQDKGLFIQSDIENSLAGKASIRACNNATEFLLGPADRVVVTCGDTVQMDVIRGNIRTSFFDSVGRNATGTILIGNSITFEPKDFTLMSGEENRDTITFNLIYNEEPQSYPVPSNSLVKIDTAEPRFPSICSPSVVLEAESKQGVIGTDATTTNQFQLIDDFLNVNATEVDNSFGVSFSFDGDILRADNNSTGVFSYDLSTAASPTGTLINFTAKDESGNVGFCTSTVFVEDTTKPVLEQLANLTKYTPAHSDTISVHWDPPVIRDLPDVFNGNKKPVTENEAKCNPNSGFEFQISNATVTCVGVDRASETNSTFFTIEVKPNSTGVEILSAIVSSENTSPDISDGDKVFVKFAQSTNKPPASTKAELDSLFNLTATHSFGTNYTGRYLTPSILEINIIDAMGATLITDITELTINSNANLKSASGFINSSITSTTLRGSFSEKAPPFITAFLVRDIGNSDPTEETTEEQGMGDVIYSVGDTFTIKFSESTNLGQIITELDTDEVNEIFEFFPQNIGDAYVGRWVNPSTFQVEITELNTGMMNPDPKIGDTRVKVLESAGLKNTLETSVNSTAKSQRLIGSFGPYTAVKNVEAGATGSVVLPSGINAELSIPDGDPFVSFIPTDEKKKSISVLGEFVDIQASNESACNAGCKLMFTFTDDDLDVNLGDLRVLHDKSGDGLFSEVPEDKETLVPEILPSSPPGPYTASVTIFSLSEIGIGVPIDNAGKGGGDTTPPSFNSAFFTGVKTQRDDGTFGFGGILSQEIEFSNSMPKAIIETGTPVKMKLVVEENGGAQALEHISLYMNLRGFSTKIWDSDTFVRYNKGKPIQIEDPQGFLKNADISILGRDGKIEVIFDMTFAKEMSTSDVFIRAWDNHKNSRDAKFVEAIQVIQSFEDKLPDELISEKIIPQDILEKWSGYSNEVLSDSEFLQSLGLEGDSIPPWYKKQIANWIINEMISQQELVDALNFFSRAGLLII